MAVPPVQPSRRVAAGPSGLVRPFRVTLMLDVVLGLLVAVTLPLAIVAIPNTISVVAALLPSDVSQIEMVRAHGLALPAMVLTVPLAGLLLRRVRAAPALIAGLALLALADAAGGYAGSAPLVGALRILHGLGAGLLVPATLVAVWGRPPVMRAVWGGMLAVSLLAAQALALWPLDEVTSWRVTLQPYPMLTGIALVLAAVYFVLWTRNGEGTVTGVVPGVVGRERLLTMAVPAVGAAVLALGTTFDWSPGLLLVAAGLSIAALSGLAFAATFEGSADRGPAYIALAVGIVVLPTAAQVTYVELGGLGGPGLSGLWPAFVAAGAAGIAAAVLVSRLSDASMPPVAAGGMVAVVAGLCAVRLLLPAADGLQVIFPFALLTVGAAVALTAALRPAGLGAALFALSLFFPGVLSGFLLGGGIQVTHLRGAWSPQAMVDAFVDALHLWALAGGGLVVVMIVLGALLGRRPAASRTRGSCPAGGGDGAIGAPAGGIPAGVVPVPAPAPPVDPASAGPVGGRTPVPEPGPSASGAGRRGRRFPSPGPAFEAADGDRDEEDEERDGQPGQAVPRPQSRPRTGPRPRPEPAPDGPGSLPVVPPPTPSPEGALGDGVDRP
ncbi:hypothetical protein GCM10017673_56920 [Streptosporangium violaceochromogenes]|nr:hypothetical protein GCM10017673_56920 [Streptosporangium violaceochromogenes]